MPEVKDLMDEVENLFHGLTEKVEAIDAEQKKLGVELVSKGGEIPAEEKSAIAARNAAIDLFLEQWKEQELSGKRAKIFGGFDSPQVKKSAGTKAMMKTIRSQKAYNGNNVSFEGLSSEELSHVSFKHMPEEIKALYAGDATSGGFFASIDFQLSLKEYQILISPMRQISQVIPCSGEKVEWPNLVNDTSAYYATEQSTYVYSGDPSLAMLNIPVHEMRGFLQLSQQNMEDSMFPLESFLKERLAKKFAQREGTAFIRGSGVGQPRGIMAYNGPYSVTQNYLNTGTPAGKLTALTYIPYVQSGFATSLGQGDCLITAMHDLKAFYRPSSTWCFTTATLGILRLIKDSQNRPLWQPFAAGGLPGTIYDRPYIEMPDMDEVGAGNFPILIGDFSNYLIADRAGVTFNIRQLDELFALQGLVGFIGRNRHGGDVLIPEAFRAIRVATT